MQNPALTSANLKFVRQKCQRFDKLDEDTLKKARTVNKNFMRMLLNNQEKQKPTSEMQINSSMPSSP